MKQIMTAGYGNLSPDQFVALLKDAGVTVVVDIRRGGSRSWCSEYKWGGPMKRWLWKEGLYYCTWSKFANNFQTLPEYEDWIATEQGRERVRVMVSSITIPWQYQSVCLVCSEGTPFEADGVTPRCHRVLVADALVKELGEGWVVVHLLPKARTK